ncbi:hypothetical protein FIU89_12920 [Roseovarius sp. THAF27]|uniref:hypothetical protein n=1 Tax=Roseovarius sp. THAF27 TaxID=2587850 RepID=UPI001268A5B0|nr:hypothetical protein [Roseovarius sp. THAF27]QFT81519.1 hypothetical protein FIU89_12920 [Roseovarius sp. THAF27]
MRNAALVLGIIGGCLALVVGFFTFGYTEFIREYGEVEGLATALDREGLVRTASFVSPLLAIAGAAMSKARALWGGILMLISAGLMTYTFGIGPFTLFPIGFVGLAGLLAVGAGKPDEPKAHF